MGSQIQQVLNILVAPPGNLVYHIILTFSVAGALQAGLVHWQRSGFPQSRRLVIGLSLLVTIRLALFLAAGAAWQGLLDERLLPPIDRAFNLISLVFILWLWAFPEHLRMADAATVLLCLLTFTQLALSLVWWSSQGQGLDYNGSWLDLTGESVAVALLLGGMLVLLLRRPNGWGFGLGMLLTLLAGHAIYLLGITRLGLPLAGNYPGPVRLFQLAAYPLLLVLPQRFPLSTAEAAAVPAAAVPERRRFGANPQLLQAFLALNAGGEPGQVCAALTRAVANAMLADICLLAVPARDAESQISIECGYDLIREEPLSGAVFPRQSVPVIESILRLGRPIRLPASSTSPDLLNLSQALRLERVGNFLAAPVPDASGAPLAEIILLSPYSNRAWDAADQDMLVEIATSLAHLLQRIDTTAQLRAEAEAARRSGQTARTEFEAADQERQSLHAGLLVLQERYQQEHLQVESLTALVKSQEDGRLAAERTAAVIQADLDSAQAALAGYQQAINSLQAENNSLRQTGLRSTQPLTQPASTATAADPGTAYLEGELRLALEEIARLRVALADIQAEPASVDVQPAARRPLQPEQQDAIETLALDLRGPLVSVINYTDFLLADSVGTLGALQRKFLERIKASTLRLTGRIDNLLQSASRGDDPTITAAEPVRLVVLLESALAATEEGRRQRSQNLQAELPDSLPKVMADPEVLQNIFTRLLQNAAAANPPNGQVGVRASTQHADRDREYVLIQVSDRGGGISPADLARLFSGPLPPGAPYAGLSDVKAAVESLQGRLWVDNYPGAGSVFSILLPANGDLGESQE